MALDAQMNWNVSMAENLERSLRPYNLERIDIVPNMNRKERVPAEDLEDQGSGNPIHLPDEIVLHILDYVVQQPASSQQTLAACSHLSHQWYAVATPLLYRAPILYGNNYEPFVRAICPSINPRVRKSPLSSLVKVLDMRNLVHQGSKSMTARLLGRTKSTLEEFYAPQASFAINCLPALSKCLQLQLLDLTLVSESPPLLDLFKTTAHLIHLRTLRLPRSSGFGVHHKAAAFPSTAWPPNLEDLSLSGGIDAHFLHGIVAFPQSLRALTIQHCPHAKGHAVTHLLRNAVRPLERLESLRIAHMPRLGGHAVDSVLRVLPQLKVLSVSADYVTAALLDEGKVPLPPSDSPLAAGMDDDGQRGEPFVHHKLRTLELTYSGSPAGVEDKLTPLDLLIAVEERSVPSLRQVRVDQALLWQGAEMREDVEALTEALQDGARRDFEAGEWLFTEKSKREGVDEEGRWRRVSGVWVF